MTRIKLERRRPWRGATRLVGASLVIAGTGSVFGCLNRPIEAQDTRTTSTIVERLTQSAVDKIDILLAIDNSGSMADKQDILSEAVPDLVEGLVNPRCVPKDGGMGAPQTVPSPSADCPEGYKREFEPIKDIHIGIISSSIGGHGARTCTGQNGQRPSELDMARLLARSQENADNDLIGETFLGKGFLAWDPDQKYDDEPGTAGPQDGEADIDDASESAEPGRDVNNTSLVGQLTKMVKGIGQTGCGFEAQLESVYRFLVDPAPYLTITVQNNNAVPEGVDETVLTQRREFLRPNSLLAIILLSDENDCSIRDGGEAYLAAEQSLGGGATFHLWRPRAECAVDPNDRCCTSCALPKPDGCPDDENCTGPDGNPARLSDPEDPINLRCWDQKRRFGFDFLYGIDRYTQAFTSAQIQDRQGQLVQNPLFSDLDPSDDESNIRDPGLVFFAGIVGVPWQDIARTNQAGEPDPAAGFKNSDELNQPILGGAIDSTWDLILGDPANYKAPTDPFMVESVAPRSGTNLITGATIIRPDEQGYNAINGREYTIDPEVNGDLQYACIFPVPPKECINGQNCDCLAGNDNPLCEPATGNSPEDPQPRTTNQIAAKAYPGTRELQLLKSLGPQGIVGSVCPKQLTDEDAPDYGYRPAIGSIIDRLKTALGGQCLPRTLNPDENGQVSCLVLEARNSDGACNCEDVPGRRDVPQEQEVAKKKVLEDPIAQASGWDCVCEIQQLEGEELAACQNDPGEDVRTGDGEVNGWCYIDPSIKVGNPAIVASCPATERRIIRFTNKGEAQLGATLFITCSGE